METQKIITLLNFKNLKKLSRSWYVLVYFLSSIIFLLEPSLLKYLFIFENGGVLFKVLSLCLRDQVDFALPID